MMDLHGVNEEIGSVRVRDERLTIAGGEDRLG
jgi:hypothetical protein